MKIIGSTDQELLDKINELNGLELTLEEVKFVVKPEDEQGSYPELNVYIQPAKEPSGYIGEVLIKAMRHKWVDITKLFNDRFYVYTPLPATFRELLPELTKRFGLKLSASDFQDVTLNKVFRHNTLDWAQPHGASLRIYSNAQIRFMQVTENPYAQVKVDGIADEFEVYPVGKNFVDASTYVVRYTDPVAVEGLATVDGANFVDKLADIVSWLNAAQSIVFSTDAPAPASVVGATFEYNGPVNDDWGSATHDGNVLVFTLNDENTTQYTGRVYVHY